MCIPIKFNGFEFDYIVTKDYKFLTTVFKVMLSFSIRV